MLLDGLFKPQQCIVKDRTDEAPCVSRFMNLHLRGIDIGRVAEEWQPHVLDVRIVECLRRW